MAEEVQFEERFNLDSIVGKDVVLNYGVGADGEAVILIVAPKYKETAFGRKNQAGAIFPFSKSGTGYPASFVRVNSNGVIQRTEIAELELAFPYIQPLPNQQVLVVGARCYYRNGDPEKNAIIFDREGKILRQFTAGDGINAVQSTIEGLIWVSYFDEGVFGNYGWNKPVGSSGLVCFDSEGRIVWKFTPPEGFGPIDDCYSLNVSHDAVWACYYSDFPVIKIDSQNKVAGWRNNVSGPKAMAVQEGRILLFGGYGENKNRCVLQDFGEQKLANSRELNLRLPGNSALNGASVIGRNSILHAFQESCWYSFDLSQMS